VTVLAAYVTLKFKFDWSKGSVLINHFN